MLTDDAERASLRNPDSLAEIAADAWRLLYRYNGQGRLRGIGGSTDTRAFQRWALEFKRRCEVDDLLAAAQLEDSLKALLNSGVRISLPDEVLLVGFDGLTPVQSGLVNAIRASGTTVEEVTVAVSQRRQILAEACDELSEMRAAARWIRRYLEERPDARVAMIVPNLEEQRARIDRVFREVLAPELENIAAKSDAAPYEFSLGVPLAQTPMVSDALSLLAWTVDPLPLTKVSRLLLSPYFAAAENERGGRAEFDAFVMRQESLLRPEATLGWLRKTIEDWQRNGKVSRLLTAVKKMQRVVEQRFAPPARRSYAGWAETMTELLEAASWGAGSSEDSIEFQTRRKWEGALDELATLDVGSARVEFRQALRRLEWIATQMMFAAESRDAAVQVMGPLEAAGSRFDALWFLSAGEIAWPPVARGTPLLPWQMQRELGMPGADIARDDAQARRVTRRIAESGETVVFSYALETARGHQRPSAVLDELEVERVAAEDFAPPASARAVVALETFADPSEVPPLPDKVHGGAEILRLQAACGFRAFAEKRLWSTELEQASMGLDVMERGNLVHHALQQFWNEVKTQDALLEMPQAAVDEVMERSIDESLRETAALSVTAWDASYVKLQRARLCTLMKQWLEIEKERPPFAVKHTEREFNDVPIGRLRLRVRVDRVDESQDGDILLDYKTGQAKPQTWLTDRPDAPQLPLYATLSDATRLQAVAFAQVRIGKDMMLTGYATDDETLTKKVALTEAPTLEAQVDRWREVLTRLATDFHQGDVRVNPKDYPTTCKHCAQRILCRLDPATLEDDFDEDDAEESERG